MPRSTREAARSLRTTAQAQGGYFTAKQAKRSGYDYPHLEYHVSTGAFERVEHGLYRLADMPAAENEDLIRLSLWSRNRADEPLAVVTHESALVLHELTELLPDEIHLTVPPGFRKEPPPGCVLHKAVLLPMSRRGSVSGPRPRSGRSSTSRQAGLARSSSRRQ
jgi:predicted transcriptional regulator of viral defense system